MSVQSTTDLTPDPIHAGSYEQGTPDGSCPGVFCYNTWIFRRARRRAP